MPNFSYNVINWNRRTCFLGGVKVVVTRSKTRLKVWYVWGKKREVEADDSAKPSCPSSWFHPNTTTHPAPALLRALEWVAFLSTSSSLRLCGPYFLLLLFSRRKGGSEYLPRPLPAPNPSPVGALEADCDPWNSSRAGAGVLSMCEQARGPERDSGNRTHRRYPPELGDRRASRLSQERCSLRPGRSCAPAPGAG